MLKSILLAAGFVGSMLVADTCFADRVVLGPAGSTLGENSWRSEFALSSSGRGGDYGWLSYSSGDGIEMELNRFEASTENKKHWAMNIEYPMPTLKNLPAISLGVRDISGTGTEHGAFYIASTSTIPLSKMQRTVIRGINVSLGAGTGRIGGAFVGVESRLTAGLTVDAEVYRRRPNIGIALPLIRNMQARAYSLNGDTFFGMSYHWSK